VMGIVTLGTWAKSSIYNEDRKQRTTEFISFYADEFVKKINAMVAFAIDNDSNAD
jgi:hypothetical protein